MPFIWQNMKILKTIHPEMKSSKIATHNMLVREWRHMSESNNMVPKNTPVSSFEGS